jgi:hypothetical protein
MFLCFAHIYKKITPPFVCVYGKLYRGKSWLKVTLPSYVNGKFYRGKSWLKVPLPLCVHGNFYMGKTWVKVPLPLYVNGKFFTVKVQGVKYTPPRKCECKTLTGKAWG